MHGDNVHSKEKYLLINWQDISEQALNGLVESFVNRDGTDYGAMELSLEQKREQGLRAIKSGRVLIVFDPDSESVNLVEPEEWELMVTEHNNDSSA